MPRAVKPKAFPAWLFDLKGGPRGPLFPYPVCMWLCSGCGAPYFFRRQGDKHTGPSWRIKDHPEWSPYLGPCWRSADYGVKCVSPVSARVLYHEKRDPPSEEFIGELTKNARRVRRELKKEAA